MNNWENNNENQTSDFILVDQVVENKENTQGEAGESAAYSTAFNSTQGSSNGSDRNSFSRSNAKGNYVTKKFFVITLIVAMIFTSALTVLITNVIGGGSSKEISATNYTLAKSTNSELSVQEVIAKNENAVVEISTESIAHDSWLSNYVTTGAGSGVIVDTKGYILTCNHVIEGANKITVTLKNGKSYESTVVGSDPQNDVAVIKIKAENLSAATYGDSSKMSVGDMVVALGNPLGQLGGSASSGIVSSLDRELTIEGQRMKLLQTDTSINPGNSGGGLFDNHGNLIGIVVAKSTGSDVEGLGFAIPINHAAEIAKDLIQHGHVTNRPAIGVQLVDASDAQIAMEYGLRMTGVYIQEVTSEEAKKAGLQAGDMFYYFGKAKIDNFADLQAELQKYKPGDKVKAVVIRDDKTVEVELHLIESTQ